MQAFIIIKVCIKSVNTFNWYLNILSILNDSQSVFIYRQKEIKEKWKINRKIYISIIIENTKIYLK